MWAVLQCEVYMHMFNYTIVHDIKGLTHSLISHYLVYNWNKVLSWGTVYCCTIHCTCTTHTMHMYTVDCVHDQNVTIHNVSLMPYYLILWIINYIRITIGSAVYMQTRWKGQFYFVSTISPYLYALSKEYLTADSTTITA